jgi:hypothetical protein
MIDDLLSKNISSLFGMSATIASLSERVRHLGEMNRQLEDEVLNVRISATRERRICKAVTQHYPLAL